MKFTLPLVALTSAFIALSTGCQSDGSNFDGTAPQPAAQAPAPTAPAADPSASTVPSTTVIDGKTVTLKSFPDGLKYYDIKVGTGASPKIGQTVSVQYTGTLLDGTKFDSSYDHGGQPIDFPIGVGSVIKGWDEGVPPMKIGGKRRLVIPGPLAYGDNPPPGTPITPNATLVFDIELVAVK